ncbi:hypothetical protein M434DRAFT_38919 [Hypoxylon sp. CO27-5]|nr:hypothetical protein M434DRAFT_38919 [Hypoxylon sp. CO27-5]
MTPTSRLSALKVARQFTMSTNSTDTSLPETASTPADPPSTSTPASTPSTDTTSTSPATSSSSTQETTTPSSTSTPETSTTSTPPPSTDTTSTTPSSTTTPTPTTPTSSTTSTTPTPTSSSVVFTTTQVSTNENGSTAFITVTSTQLNTNTPQETVQPTSTDASGQIITTNTSSSNGRMTEPAKIAVAVVVPIVAVALLLVAGIFFWRKRKQQKDAAEERRKEVEDYSYNPNNDPTLPDMGSAAGAYEMKEDGSSGGYRGWGSTTLAGSTGRKASTTMSGGAAAGVAYSDATSPTRGNFSDTRSGDGLINDGGSSPPEGEILGAMGPNTNENRGNGQVHRGPSNASSSYSAAGRSDGSGDQTGSCGGPAYLDQYGGNNPYADGAYGQQQLGGQPVIRDNPARRNTRIENPSHYPQQSAGISQNF